MPLYPIKTPVKKDGVIQARGSIKLTTKEAAPLLALGAIGQPAGRGKAAATNKE